MTVLRCDNNVVDITVTNDVDVVAVEIVFTITGSGGAWFDSYTIDWDPAFTELGTRVLDLSQANGASVDTIRMAAMLIDSADVMLMTGTHVVAQIDFSTNASCGGTVALEGAVYDYPIPATITTQFVDANTFDIVPAAFVPLNVNWSNLTPDLAAIPDDSLHWGALYSYTAMATDGDNCEKLTYSKVTGPATMSVNATTGQITWLTTGADVCTHAVEIMVTDSCGATDVEAFSICVYNDEPVADSILQDQPEWVMGDVVEGQAYMTDPDAGPGPLYYSLASFTGPGVVTVDGGTGEFTWPTVAFDPAYVGDFVLCIEATDNANLCDPCSPENADTICIDIHIAQAIVVIEKEHGTTDNDGDGCLDGVLMGQFAYVDVSLDGNIVMGGFDFLMAYDASALTFMGAEPGEALTDCDWEYFTYRTGPWGNCDGGCPTGMIRVVGIAEQNDGPDHPDYGCTGTMFELEFLVTSDHNYECQFVPITFYWLDCGDNTISSQYGDTLYLSHSVWNYYGEGCPDVIPDSYNLLVVNDGIDFPAIDGAPDTCETLDKAEPWRVLDMFNGGIDIICVDVIDDRGDINLDGLPYTVADAVMFANYFVFGLDALVEGAEAASAAASDVNADGLTLTVADLVYLVRVIVGDAAPYAPSGYLKLDPIAAKLEMVNGVIGLADGMDVSGAALVLEGEVTPELLVDNMNMLYNFDGTNTNVVVYPQMVEGSEIMESFNGDFLSTQGATIVSIEMAAKDGNPINVDLSGIVPADFGLEQNYPNPFNPTTTLSFSMPESGDFSIKIYNVTGQLVDQIDGNRNAGFHTITWDAADLSSGVYFYKLTVNNYTDTKKMVLLK